MFVFKPQIDTSSLAQDEPEPSTFLETLEANTEILGSAFRNAGREEEAYDARNDAIFTRLGVKLENPARQAQGYQLGGVDWRGQYDQQLKDLQAQYPDAADIIRADVSPATEAAQQTAAVQQRAADTAARYPYRLPDSVPLVGGQSIPSMVGGLVTGATDPFTAPTLLIAPARVAEGAAGVLWAGLRSGAANAVGSAAEQPYIAAWKKQAGLEHTFSDALKEVAANAAFGFLADVGVRGLYRGGQALAGRRPILDDAGNVIGYRGATDPKANPIDALNDAAFASPPGSVLRKAAELDPDALREVARHTGLDADPAVRGALDALEQDRLDQVPPAGVMEPEHIAKANDAITAANDPKALPVGDAIVGGHGPDAAPERLREVLARDPIELAADIRETPEILAEGLPWTDPKLKAAAQLSKLSDQAFDMVAGGEVDPRLGTLVAEHVADPGQHAPLLRQLSEAAPATPDAARAKLADLLAGPRDEVTHARTAGIADELVDRPVTLVDDPYGADGMRQLEQLRRDLSAEIEAATGKAPELAAGDTPAARRPPAADTVSATVAPAKDAPSAHARLADALDKAIGRLPEGVKVKTFSEISDLPDGLRRDVMAARSGGSRPEGLTERQTGNVWIAADALDFDGTLSHETVHSLRETGLLSDAELQVLADAAAKVPDLFDRERYAAAYAYLSPKDFNDAMLQEAAAHLYEARANGANFGKKANAILRKIQQFLERARNALNGLGWHTADDIMKAIDDGTIARRAMRSVDGPRSGALFALGRDRPTIERPGYGTPEDEAARLFNIDGREVKGVEAATQHLEQVARAYAGPDGPAKGRRATILIGPPGAGKTTVGEAIARGTRSAIVTADDAKQIIPEYERGAGSAIVHEESADLAFATQRRLMEGGENVLVEKLGSNGGSILRVATLLKELGYNVDVVSVSAPRDVLIERIARRAARTGRTVPTEELDRTLSGIGKTLENVKSSDAVRGIVEIDNSGEKPLIVSGKETLGHDGQKALDDLAEARLAGVVRAGRERRDGQGPGEDGGRTPEEGQGPAGTGEVDPNKNDGGALFSLRDDAQAQLKEDLAQVASIADAKAKAQRERQALIDEKIRQNNERFVTTLRDARGQVDPAKALVYLLENHGQVDLPAGMTSVAAEQKAVEAMAKAGMEEVLHTFRPTLLTGKTRETARLRNLVREMAGEGTGDAAAKALAQAVMRTNERLRQEFNAAGGDIPKLEGWFLPQVHDRAALLAAGRAKWVDDIWKGLDTERMLRTVRDEASPDTINAEARKLVATTEASKQVRDREVAQHDAEAKQARDEMKTRHADERAALAQDLEATRSEIRASREKELTQARSIRDQQKAAVKPAERGILSERFERARAEIERTTERDLAAADREHARLVRKWEAARQAEIEKFDKAAAKAREKAVATADKDHATRVDDARVAHDHRLAQGEPLSPERLREILGDIWENNTSDGHGTQAANATDPFGGITGDATGAKKIGNQRQEHRFLHFKSADAWLDYQKQYGGGADPFRAAMQHITSMSKDIAAMRVLGTNPNRELARLAKFATKQAKLARPAAKLVDEAVSKIKELTAELMAQPSRLDEVTDRIGEIHKEIARIREKRIGPPSRRNKKKIEVLRDELFKLDGERIELTNNGQYKVGGNAAAAIAADLSDAFDELAAVQDVDKVLFPKKTEFLGKTMTQSGFWTTAPEDYARSYISRAEAMWDLYRGVTSSPVNAKAASLMQMLRNVGVVGRGGSMVISSIADNFTQVMARRFTGLPAHQTFTDILQQLGPNAHREAQRQALIGETYLHMFNDGARGAASLQGPEWSHWLAERTIALQGLSALTDAQRQAFGMSLQAAIADLAVKSWADVGALNPRLQKLFQRYGLGETEWDAIRLDPATGLVRDVDFLSPNLVRDSLEAAGRGNERVAERYLGMILQESDFASPTSMLRARAAMVGKTRPGTLVGEFLRTAGQFKQFSFMFGMLHFERALREGIANGTLKGASYAAQTLLVMTLGGALVVQLKDLKGGKDPRPMDRPGFWGAALMQGGGLGIVGDIFNSEQNRFGGGLVSTFAGPVFGLGEDILGAAGISPKTTAARGSARLATSYVPGSSLWYLNLAYQRTVADTLQRYVDPKAYDAFRRRQTQQLKDYGNGFWWAPGQRAPSRAPRLN